MPKTASLHPNWDTSSYGEPAESSALNRTALSAHLSVCGALRGPLQAAWGGIDALLGWMCEHTVTAALLITVLVSVAWLVL
jgi:hypothetical protein